MSYIKDVKNKIDDLKILIDNAIFIHIFNNLYIQFCLYFIILNHKI